MLVKTAKQAEAVKLIAGHRHTLLFGGSRCVSGDTILDGHDKTIKELAEAGQPIMVRTSHGWQMAEAPYKKGIAQLLEIETEDGRLVKVTSDHRFWNGEKWIRACDLVTGDSIACSLSSSAQILLPTNSEFCLSEFLLSVPRLTEKPADYLDDYSDCPHRYDRQLRYFLAAFLTCCALQHDVLVRNHACHFLYSPELNIHALQMLRLESGDNQSDHTSRPPPTMDDSLGSYLPSEFSSREFAQIFARFLALFENDQKFPQQFFLHRSFELPLRNFLDLYGQFFFHENLSCDLPNSNGYIMRRVLSSTLTAEQDFYTLHVPNCEHYFANGIMHHNSGKTFLSCYAIAVRALKAPKSRHAILRFRFNHVKQSVWYDTFPKMMAICFPDVGYKENKSDWFITMPNGSEIWFGGLDDKQRVEKILGNEYATIYFNECSQIAYESVTTAMTRLAQKTELQNRALYDCNPPGKSHWTYRLFVEGVDPISRENRDTSNYAHMLMNPIDNMMNLSSDYQEVLASLPPRQRARFELGQWLDDIEGALWKGGWIDQWRQAHAPDLVKVVVGVDPAVTANEHSDLTGIIVMGLDAKGIGYVLADKSTKASPQEWAERVVSYYTGYNADAVVVETNQGGEMAKTILRSIMPHIPVVEVRASKGKIARAEPVAALYEQGRIQHVGVHFDLEEELTTYNGEQKSPDRMDALVWAAHHLMINPTLPPSVRML